MERPKLTFSKKVSIELTEHPAEPVGIFFGAEGAAFEGVFDPVVSGKVGGSLCLKDARFDNAAHRDGGSRLAFEGDDSCGNRIRTDGSNKTRSVVAVDTEAGEGVVVLSCGECLCVFGRERMIRHKG